MMITISVMSSIARARRRDEALLVDFSFRGVSIRLCATTRAAGKEMKENSPWQSDENSARSRLVNTRLVPATATAVEEAVACLNAGQLVGLPTETVYGLAGDATSTDAVEKIFQAKKRPSFDPLIIHVEAEGREALRDLDEKGLINLACLDPAAQTLASELIEAFWPGGLTVVLPVGDIIAPATTSGLDTVAVRAPRHPIFRAVLQRVGVPLAAPSANRFGRISPTRGHDVLAELNGRIPLILDDGPCQIGVESTVLRVEAEGRATLLRSGATSRRSIERVLGASLASPAPDDQNAPGRMSSHYAPALPVYLLDLANPHRNPTAWFLARYTPDEISLLLAAPPTSEIEEIVLALGRTPRVLTASGDDRDAARHLFSYLRELESSGTKVILAEKIERRDGLWAAIAERLEKASKPWPVNND